MGQGMNEPFWQHPMQLGKPGTHSHVLTFPTAENMGQEGLSWDSAVPPGGRVVWIKSTCSSYCLQCVSYLVFSQWCARTTGLLEFPKGSLTCGWLAESVFFRYSWFRAQRGWSQFTGHVQVHSIQKWHRGLYVYNLMHEWVRLLPGPLVCGVDRTKARQGCSWTFRGTKSLLGMQPGPGFTRQLPEYRPVPVFSKQLSSFLDCTGVSQSASWIPQLPQRNFCPQMNAKLLLLSGAYMQGMSYSSIVLMSFYLVLIWMLWLLVSWSVSFLYMFTYHSRIHFPCLFFIGLWSLYWFSELPMYTCHILWL